MNKTISILALLITLAGSQVSFAQASKIESFKVAGECKMCKKHIESSALKAGAGNAVWNVDTKVLKVNYVPGKTDATRIQQAIAAAGYDTPAFAADTSAYNSLDECCRYERLKKDTRKQ